MLILSITVGAVLCAFGSVEVHAKQVQAKDLFTLSSTNEAPRMGVFDRGIFVRNGIKYRKFESDYGSIFVLDGSTLLPGDIEKAQCVAGMAFKSSRPTDTPLVVAAGSGDDKEAWQTYAALIQQTIKSKCDGTIPLAVQINPHLDLGISHSIRGKDGVDTQLKVFNRDLGLNLNLKADF